MARGTRGLLVNSTDFIAVSGLATGVVLLLAAGVISLMRATAGIPAGQRLQAMATIAWRPIRRNLPSRHSVATAAAGFGAFIVFGTACAGICWGLLMWYASSLPWDDNVVAGAAQAGLMMLYAMMGFGFSLTVGMIGGTVVAIRVSDRLSQGVGGTNLRSSH
jgi:lysylphosphatidylglycerol synthetase-like protein (DUF2156 family)